VGLRASWNARHRGDAFRQAQSVLAQPTAILRFSKLLDLDQMFSSLGRGRR